MKEIRGFNREYLFLSNFYRPVKPIVTPKGHKADTVEHLFQAAKTTDPEQAARILAARDPKEAKAMGRRVTLRPDWDKVKVRWMKEFLRWKFTQDQSCHDRLLATDDALLIEDNYWHDNYWGNCTCPKCKDKPGRNVLGYLLMEIRVALRLEQDNPPPADIDAYKYQ